MLNNLGIKSLSDSLIENTFFPKSLIECPRWYNLLWSIIIYLSCTLEVYFTSNPPYWLLNVFMSWTNSLVLYY